MPTFSWKLKLAPSLFEWMDLEEKLHACFGNGRKPYEIQQQVMQLMIRAMRDGKCAVLESPTGTGKSMSIIVSCLYWLKNEAPKKVASADQPSSATPAVDDSEPDWVNEYYMAKAKKEV
jgi:chromosome transmission fidelity protein 1